MMVNRKLLIGTGQEKEKIDYYDGLPFKFAIGGIVCFRPIFLGYSIRQREIRKDFGDVVRIECVDKNGDGIDDLVIEYNDGQKKTYWGGQR